MLSCWFRALSLSRLQVSNSVSTPTLLASRHSLFMSQTSLAFTAFFSFWAPQSSTLGIYGCLASVCSVCWEQFANYGVINKTNTLCEDTDINHGATREQWEERKSIFDCLSKFQIGPVKTERVWAQDIRGALAGAGSAGGWLSAHSSGFMCGSAEIHLPLCQHGAPEQTLPPL